MLRTLTLLCAAPLALSACSGPPANPDTDTDTTTDESSSGSTTGDTPTTVDIPATTTEEPTGTTVGPGDTTTGTTDPSGTTDPTTGEPEEVVVYVEGFEQPESVLWSADAQAWFVSNIAGDPGMKDGVGYISKLAPDGTVEEMMWAAGLDAPKGMAAIGGTLFVADIDQVLAFDLATAQVAPNTQVLGALFLNDVAAGPDEFVYVSDTLGNAIYRFQIGTDPQLVLMDDALDGPNGLAFADGVLYVTSYGSADDPNDLGTVLKVEGDVVTVLGDLEGTLDGLVVDGDSLLVTEFPASRLHRVAIDGGAATLVRDFAEKDGFMSTADIGFSPDERILGVPDLLGGKVAFYTVPE